MSNPTPFQQVGEFHEVFGHPKTTVPQVNICQENKKLVDFRYALIDEEVKEFEEACAKYDFLEAVDALCDTLYVIYGACHVFGLVELDKLNDVDMEDCDVLKPVSLDKQKEWFEENATMVDSFVTMLKTFLQALKTACDDQNFENINQALITMTGGLYFIGASLGVNVVGAFSEVHRSNMTKVCLNEENAQQTVEWYLQNEKRYEKPSYRKSVLEKYWVVYDAKTSKILKSIYFELPNLKPFLPSHMASL
jgi:predicted HAD superfamily Cof-like phosphohydrolase